MKIQSLVVAIVIAGLGFAGKDDPSPVQASTIHGTALSVDIYGNLFVLDSEASILREYSRDRVLIHEVGGQGWETDRFDRPMGIWAQNGIDVYIADYGNHRIQRYDRNLTFVSSLYTRDNPNPDQRFGYPSDVSLSRTGDLFICDTDNSRIVKVNLLNGVFVPFGGFGAGQGRLLRPWRAQVGPKDNVYVLDAPRVVVFDNFGNYVQELAPGVFTHPTALFADDQGVAVLDSSTVYFFDQDNRPGPAIQVEPIVAPEPVHIRSIAASNGVFYLLAESGLYTVADPRK
jgi:hypothetical protein